VNVAAPFISVCNDPGNTPYCDGGMLERLKAFEGDDGQNDKEDPRWDALRDIK
jgi:hypothetical protein